MPISTIDVVDTMENANPANLPSDTENILDEQPGSLLEQLLGRNVRDRFILKYSLLLMKEMKITFRTVYDTRSGRCKMVNPTDIFTCERTSIAFEVVHFVITEAVMMFNGFRKATGHEDRSSIWTRTLLELQAASRYLVSGGIPEQFSAFRRCTHTQLKHDDLLKGHREYKTWNDNLLEVSQGNDVIDVMLSMCNNLLAFYLLARTTANRQPTKEQGYEVTKVVSSIGSIVVLKHHKKCAVDGSHPTEETMKLDDDENRFLHKMCEKDVRPETFKLVKDHLEHVDWEPITNFKYPVPVDQILALFTKIMALEDGRTGNDAIEHQDARKQNCNPQTPHCQTSSKNQLMPSGRISSSVAKDATMNDRSSVREPAVRSAAHHLSSQRSRVRPFNKRNLPRILRMSKASQRHPPLLEDLEEPVQSALSHQVSPGQVSTGSTMDATGSNNTRNIVIQQTTAQSAPILVSSSASYQQGPMMSFLGPSMEHCQTDLLPSSQAVPIAAQNMYLMHPGVTYMSSEQRNGMNGYQMSYCRPTIAPVPARHHPYQRIATLLPEQAWTFPWVPVMTPKLESETSGFSKSKCNISCRLNDIIDIESEYDQSEEELTDVAAAFIRLCESSRSEQPEVVGTDLEDIPGQTDDLLVWKTVSFDMRDCPSL